VAEETKVSSEMNTAAETLEPESSVTVPAPGAETASLYERARKGDESCLPQVRALLDDPERGDAVVEAAGSPAEWLLQSLTQQMAGKDVLVVEAARQKFANEQADIEGPNPTSIERILAERASLCWFAVNLYEEWFANAKDMSLGQADYFQRRIQRAHQRFLSAVETLSRVRKLAVPALQLNIARNQVNVAGSGQTGASLQ
jgi:hypothetical protein